MRDMSGNKNPFFGKQHTEETNTINRLAHLGKVSPNKGIRSQFCHKGHDKEIVGRTVGLGCKSCGNEARWKAFKIINPDGTPFSSLDYDRNYQLQSGKCLICNKHSTEFTKRLAVDHNHETGIFRGLLCTDCNTKLGTYELIREKAEKYLS